VTKEISAKTKRVYTCPPDRCNAKRHMPATTVMKVWDVMSGFAAYWQKQNEGRLIFSASVRPTLANAVPCEPQTADEAIAWLLKNDWIVLEEASRRRKDNTLGPNTYRLRTHEEYVKLHPGNCPSFPCRPNDEAEPIRVPARQMSMKERDQWLQYSPQAAPIHKIFTEMAAIWENMSPQERTAYLESLKDFEAPDLPERAKSENWASMTFAEKLAWMEEPYTTPVLTGEGATPVMAGATPVLTGEPHSGYGTTPTPVMAGKPLRLEPEVSPLITQTHHTQPIPVPSATPCDVCVDSSKPSAKGESTLVAKTDLAPEKPQPQRPVVEAELAPRAAVARLIAHGDGKFPLNITPSQRKQLEAKAEQFGGNVFLNAAMLWVKDEPWNSKTTHPYVTLIAGFEGYVKRTDRVAKEKRDDAQTKLAGEVSGFVYQIQHHFGPEFIKTLSQSEQELLKTPYSNPEQMKEIANKGCAWSAEQHKRDQKEKADIHASLLAAADDFIKKRE